MSEMQEWKQEVPKGNERKNEGGKKGGWAGGEGPLSSLQIKKTSHKKKKLVSHKAVSY